MTIGEMIEFKEKELKELEELRKSIKDTVYSFYGDLAEVAKQDWEHYYDLAKKVVGHSWGINLAAPQRWGLLRKITKNIVKETIGEITGDSEIEIDKMTIKEVIEVRKLLEEKLKAWMIENGFV